MIHTFKNQIKLLDDTAILLTIIKGKSIYLTEERAIRGARDITPYGAMQAASLGMATRPGFDEPMGLTSPEPLRLTGEPIGGANLLGSWERQEV